MKARTLDTVDVMLAFTGTIATLLSNKKDKIDRQIDFMPTPEDMDRFDKYYENKWVVNEKEN